MNTKEIYCSISHLCVRLLYDHRLNNLLYCSTRPMYINVKCYISISWASDLFKHGSLRNMQRNFWTELGGRLGYLFVLLLDDDHFNKLLRSRRLFSGFVGKNWTDPFQKHDYSWKTNNNWIGSFVRCWCLTYHLKTWPRKPCWFTWNRSINV